MSPHTGEMDRAAARRVNVLIVQDHPLLASAIAKIPHTVEWHVRHVIEKLQVHSKLQAVISAARKGLIEL